MAPNPEPPDVEALLRTAGLDRLPPTRLDKTITPRDLALAATHVAAGPAPSPPGAAEPLPRITLTAAPLADGASSDGGRDASEFDVTTVLGEGGMGSVLLAHQRSLDRDVAVKVLKRAHAADASLALALRDEGHVMGRVEHPNVVPVYALGRDERALPALVMKRVEGVSWRELVTDPRHRAWANVQTVADDRLAAHLEILMDVCNAVHFAHSRGVVHRDIKTENVIVGRFGEVYLADWGIALRAEPGARDGASSRELVVVGTPVFMAPEMLSGDAGRVDARTDVYLLGAALHEVLTGGQPRHPGATLAEVLAAAYESAPREYPASVPAELGAICNRATHRDPAARFASALEFRGAVADYLRHRGSIALSDAAGALLERLRAQLARDGAALADAELGAVYRLGAECRFAYAQALREWSGNAAARDGLRACLEALAGFELARGSADAARALLAELPEPGASEALRAELAALDARLRAARARSAALERHAREMDLSASAALYARLIVPMGGVLAVIMAVTTWFKVRYGQVPLRTELGASGVVLVTFGLSVLLNRRRLLDRAADRQVVALLGSMFGAVFAHRAVCTLAGVPFASVMFAGDAAALAAIVLFGGFVLYRWLWVGTALFAAAAVAGALAPPAAGLAFGGASLGLIAIAAWRWRAAGRRAPQGAATSVDTARSP